MARQPDLESENSPQVRIADAKGRIGLGSSYANLPVTVKQISAAEWVVTVVEPIPMNQAWLFKNREALNLVTHGIMEAQQGKFATDPRKGKDYAWLSGVGDEEDDKVD